MMVQKSSFPLQKIQNELRLKVIVHFSSTGEVVQYLGVEELINSLIKSNLLVVLRSDMPPMPIRLANNEIYEMVLQNDRGIVAKEGRVNRYLVALKMNNEDILAAIGDDLDPGMVLFEFLRYQQE
jgi:hypothetical protein